MAKIIQFRDDARESIRRGVSQVARAARGTLGPRGRHVILQQQDGSLLVTKDGVTVVRQIDLEDPFENIGAQLVKQVATTTGERAGDGTTTATILAEAIFVEGLKAVAAGINPIQLEQGIRQAVRDITAQLEVISEPVKDKRRLRQVATVASNGDEQIGELLADVLLEAGDEGLVLLEEGTGARTEVEWVNGIRLNRGYLSPYFVNHAASRETRLDNAAILVCDHTLSNLQELLPLLEQVVNAKRELLIIAGDVQGEALASLVVNATRGVLLCCAVKAPEFGDVRRDVLEDLAVFTGGAAIFTDAGGDLKERQLAELGSAKRVVVTSDSTTLLDGAGRKSEITERVRQIEGARAAASEGERSRLDRRAAQLRGRVATIRVGANTESELKEKMARFDDALHAARAAREDGIVAGGGVALVRAARTVSPPEDQTDVGLGYRIVLRACQAPLVAIADNAGRSGTATCQRVVEGEGDFGYDAARDEFCPLMKSGIVDAVKVVRRSLESAASLAATLLCSDALVS